MKLFKTIDKVLGGFGNISAMRRNHVDTFTEELIENISGEKIAESVYGQLYISYQNISDYEFLNASVLSGSNIKTYKGCDMIFESQNHRIAIPSDTQEIESDFSNVSNRWLTKISFIIDETNKEMISNGDFEKVYINHKKKSLVLDKAK